MDCINDTFSKLQFMISKFSIIIVSEAKLNIIEFDIFILIIFILVALKLFTLILVVWIEKDNNS